MLNKIKMTYKKIREKFDPSILKSVNTTVRRYKKEELRELIATEEGQRKLADKVFYQLPEGVKSPFKDNDEAKAAFVADVVTRLTSILENPKLHKKVFGTK